MPDYELASVGSVSIYEIYPHIVSFSFYENIYKNFKAPHAARMCTLPIAVEIDFVAASLNTYLLYVNDILLPSYIVTTTIFGPPQCVHLPLKIIEDPTQEEALVRLFLLHQ